MGETANFFKWVFFALVACLVVLGAMFLFIKSDSFFTENPVLYIGIFAFFLIGIWIVYVFAARSSP